MDGDGGLDMIVTNLTNEGSTLFGHSGDRGFFDISARTGLAPATALFTGFGVGWFDFDNDGWLDLYMANGAVRHTRQVAGPDPYRQRNLLFRNVSEGGGRQMRDVSGEAGEALAFEEVSRAAVFGDIDNDGDVDILVTNNGGPARLLLNESAMGRHWLRAEVAPGACVEPRWKDGRSMRGCAQPHYSYLASNDPRVHFGLGEGPAPERLVIVWPDGTREEFGLPRVDRAVRVKRGAGSVIGR
jgi:hypothetical protein